MKDDVTITSLCILWTTLDLAEAPVPEVPVPVASALRTPCFPFPASHPPLSAQQFHNVRGWGRNRGHGTLSLKYFCRLFGRMTKCKTSSAVLQVGKQVASGKF